MNSSEWQNIENVFDAALELSGDERLRFVADKCAGNEPLRREVESLLQAFVEQPEFLEEPAFETAMQVIEDESEKSLIGEQVLSYRIISKLGGGGMGDVYLAEDTELERRVALKFWSNPLVDDKWAKRQLIKEAQAAARLDHPNICQVYSIEQHGAHDFIVMQYCEGETLREQIQAKRITAEKAVSLARQIAAALAEAHAHGVIHRDIKPGNIMVTANGAIKVLDFGLAKTVHTAPQNHLSVETLSNATHNNLIAGTLAYMSPEQLRGEKLDFRSDIFSFGIVLHELVSGEHPFARNSRAETISAVLSEPPPFKKRAVRIAPHLNRIIKKCLEKDKEQRYQSMNELLLELDKLEPAGRVHQKNGFLTKDFSLVGWSENRFSTTLALAFAFVVFLAVAATLASFRANRTVKVAVLPFTSESSETNFNRLGEEMTESLINRLKTASKLTVKPFTVVENVKNGSDNALEIGRQLTVDAVVVGKIERRGEVVVLENSLIRVSDNAKLWSEENVFTEADALKLEKRAAQRILLQLDYESLDGGAAKSDKRQTDNAEAFKYYLRGRQFWRGRNKENIEKAIAAFHQAIEIDPTYARAYAGLADSYVLQSSVAYGSATTGDSMSKAKAAAKQALEIDDRLCESHAALGVVLFRYDWNWAAAEKELQRAVELNPDYAPAHFWYSDLLAMTKRYDEALIESRKAKELDPFSPLSQMNVGRVLYYARRFDEANDYLNHVLADDPNNSKAKYLIGLTLLQKAKYEDARVIFQNLYDSNEKDLATAALGFALGKLRRTAEASRLLDELEEKSKIQRVPPQERAIIYIGLGDHDRALEWLEKSFDEHLASLIALNTDPLFDDLRANAEFINLIKRMNLQPAAPAIARRSDK